MVRLFSHSDLDGVGCGILAQLAFGKDCRFRFIGVRISLEPV